MIIGNQNGMSAKGGSWVAGRKRVRIDAEKGETSVTRVKIENPDNYNQFATLAVVDNGANGRLEIQNQSGTAVQAFNL